MKVAALILICLILAVIGTFALAEETQGASNMVNEASLDLSFRYRYEGVDQDGFSNDAKASTLRSRLTINSGSYNGFKVLLELDDVHAIATENYNAGAGNTPFRTQYPVVADPEGTEINQVYVDFNGIENLTFRGGRHRINYDNQRFVGGVGWRQNEQTYDAVSLIYAKDSLKANYAWVSTVKRIFGEDVPAGRHNQDGTHLINLSTQLAETGRLSGYYYRIENEDAPAFSTSTLGLRFAGSLALDTGRKISYTAEYAKQTDIANNPVDISANYLNLGASLTFSIFEIGAGWEVLEGDKNALANEAFRTPLATLHAFNGWADKFLTTPAAGLDDRFVKAKANFGSALVQVIYHDFEAEDGGANLGNELDLRIGYKFSQKIRGDVFLASYEGGSGIADTTKIWFMLSARI